MMRGINFVFFLLLLINLPVLLFIEKIYIYYYLMKEFQAFMYKCIHIFQEKGG